jgi:hypothetical protein
MLQDSRNRTNATVQAGATPYLTSPLPLHFVFMSRLAVERRSLAPGSHPLPWIRLRICIRHRKSIDNVQGWARATGIRSSKVIITNGRNEPMPPVLSSVGFPSTPVSSHPTHSRPSELDRNSGAKAIVLSSLDVSAEAATHKDELMGWLPLNGCAVGQF